MRSEIVHAPYHEETERTHYRLRRYLSGVSIADLDARLVDIASNLYTFTTDAKVGLIDGNPRDFWLSRLGHLYIENTIRNRPTVGLRDVKEFTFTGENIEKFGRHMHVTGRRIDEPIFCRYGELHWMRELQDTGKILLRPASYYSDHTLNTARRDYELTYTAYVCPHDYDLGLINSRLQKLIPTRGYGKIVHRKPCDHYLCSFTAGFHVRLFADFGADACLIITDQDEFERRLIAGVQKALPRWEIHFGPVGYRDPYFQTLIQLASNSEIFFLKHARYMYQREFRLIALPPSESSKPLPSLPVAIGSLWDISELVCLEGHPFAREASVPVTVSTE